MRRFFLVFGWASLVGSVGDSIVGLYGLWVVGADGWSEPGLSVDTLLRDHISFLYWVKQVAYVVLPKALVTWTFALPALLYFPIRVVVSTLLGWWALNKARQYPDKNQALR